MHSFPESGGQRSGVVQPDCGFTDEILQLDGGETHRVVMRGGRPTSIPNPSHPRKDTFDTRDNGPNQVPLPVIVIQILRIPSNTKLGVSDGGLG
jgi:hypothetical protein